MQLIADSSFKNGICQIGKFGHVLDISDMDSQNSWAKQISFKTQPYIESAFSITKGTTKFFKFGLPHYDTQTFSFAKTVKIK